MIILLLSCIFTPAFTATVVIPTRLGEDYPKTKFSCKDRPMNAFYGDVGTNCEVFHICLWTEQGTVEDIRMKCPPSSLFDQESGRCRRSEKVDCLKNYELTEKVVGRIMKYWNTKVKRQISILEEPEQKVAVQNQEPAVRFSEPPKFNEHQMPVTSFSCRGKVIGGYYADPETRCQMFHVCLYLAEWDHVMDTKFLCLNGTVFDQEHFVCNDWRKVDCSQAEKHYARNDELFLVHG